MEVKAAHQVSILTKSSQNTASFQQRKTIYTTIHTQALSRYSKKKIVTFFEQVNEGIYSLNAHSISVIKQTKLWYNNERVEE